MPLASPGGKFLASKKWAPLILTLTEKRAKYVEPCVGGANMLTHLSKHFGHCFAGDLNQDLVMLWQAVKDGWDPPEWISPDEHAALKLSTEHSALRGFAGYGCSFAAIWFATYNNGAGKTRRAVLKSKEALQNTTLRHCSYEAWGDTVDANTVVYADPPYANVSMGFKGAGVKFDHAHFWSTMDSWVEKKAAVFVSEYAAPDGWKKVSELNNPKTLSSTKRGQRQLDCLFTK